MVLSECGHSAEQMHLQLSCITFSALFMHVHYTDGMLSQS